MKKITQTILYKHLLNSLIDVMFHNDPYRKITNTFKPESIHNDNGNGDFYYYIPSYNEYIKTVLLDLLKDSKLSTYTHFIDIGAGTPLIMDIFRQALPKPIYYKKFTALELSDIYCEVFPPLTKGNLLTYNFKEYDVLYSYNPIRNSDLMIEGLKNIISTMKEGAILYFVEADYKVRDYFENTLKSDHCILLDSKQRLYKYTK